MKVIYFIIFFFILIPACKAQTASYSNQGPRILYTDEMQLIANVGDKHHLLVIVRKQPPVVFVYDQQLNLQLKKTLTAPINPGDDVQIFHYKDFYYLLTYSVINKKQTFWKINALGTCVEMTTTLNQLLQKQVGDSNARVQLSTGVNRLYLIRHTYYPDTKMVSTTQVIADSLLQVQMVRQVSYPFKRESIYQCTIIDDDHLLLLTTGKNEEEENFLKLTNVNTNSGQLLATNYKSSGGFFLNPHFYYNSKDSTTLLYATVQASPINGSKKILISHFTDSLTELAPAALQNTAHLFYFVLVDGPFQKWLRFTGTSSLARYPTDSRTYRLGDTLGNLFGEERHPSLFSSAGRIADNKNNLAIQFSILDHQLKNIADSVAANDQKRFHLLPAEFATFTVRGHAYLLMKQRFPSKGTGLLLVYGNPKTGLQSTDARVYERYDYLLNQLQQTSDEAVLIPFLNKQEGGIMKLKMQELTEQLPFEN